MLTKIQADRLHVLQNGIWSIRQNCFHRLLANATKPMELIEREQEIVAAKSPVSSVRGSVGVIPIRGVIAQHIGDWYGETWTETIGASIDVMEASSQVGCIILDIDSPGGIVYGVQETWKKIRDTKKPTVAVINSEAASAAYYIASACDEIVITPGGQSGSIGVYSMHIDASKMLDEMGWKVTFIHAGEYKVEGNSFEPLTDEAKKHFQHEVDVYYDAFVSSVAKGRGVSKSKVLSSFGQGRMYGAEESVERGLADRIGTFEQVIEKLTSRKRNSASSRAASLKNKELRLRAMGL
jgi:signal peptide peptidase SppA